MKFLHGNAEAKGQLDIAGKELVQAYRLLRGTALPLNEAAPILDAIDKAMCAVGTLMWRMGAVSREEEPSSR